MLMSKKCQYALRAVFELGLRDPRQPVKIHEIAGAQDIPARFLEVILNQLRHAGFAESQRGSEGGYMLARRAEDLTVGEVIQCIQGPISVTNDGTRKPKRGNYFYGDYAFKQLWQSVSSAISQVWDSTTFAELIEYENAKKTTAIPDYAI
jgi:Rrf2 family protein